MMKDKSIIRIVILSVALIVAAEQISSGIVEFKDHDRQVSVKGLAEKEVKADKVTWPLMYKEIGNDPVEMYNSLERKNNAIVRFLKGGGIKDDEISINPPAITDRQANDYVDNNVPFRYKATSVITVTSADVDKVRSLMRRQTELMKLGIPIIAEEYGDNKVSYEFTGLNNIKPGMVEEATRNARATAEKFASDSGSKLGRINHASQGQFSIEDRDATTPYIKNVRVVITMDYMLD